MPPSVRWNAWMIRRQPPGANWIGNGGDGLTIPETGWKLVEDWYIADFKNKTKNLEDSFTVSFGSESMYGNDN